MENKVAKRLLELRRERKLSQAELGRLTGIEHGSIGRWENGDWLPGVDNIIKLCLFFGCSADYLIGLKDE